jgi:hypothetical protein
MSGKEKNNWHQHWGDPHDGAVQDVVETPHLIFIRVVAYND